MKLFDESRWQIIKQEYQAVILLSIFQIWWCINYQPFHRMAAPWTTFFPLSISALGIFIIGYMFMFSEQFAYNTSYKHIEDFIDLRWFKKISAITNYGMMILVFFLMWYFDVSRLPTMHYVIMFCFFVSFQILFKRAIRRNPLVSEQE